MMNPDPIIEDFTESMAAIRARGLVSNLYRYTLPAVGVIGMVGASYAGMDLSNAVSVAVEQDMGLLSSGARDLYTTALTDAVESVHTDVTALIEATGSFFNDNLERFRDGTLMTHYDDQIRSLPAGDALANAFQWAVETKPGADTLHEKYGPAIVGVASVALTVGAVAAKGKDVIQGGLNAMAFGWKQVREGVERGINRARGFEPPSPEAVFDPMRDPTPEAISGDPDKENAIASDLAERFEEMGAPSYVAHDIAREQVASLSAAGHRIRNLEEENGSQKDRIRALEEDMDDLKSRVDKLSEAAPSQEERRREIASVLLEMSVHGRAEAPETGAPTLH